MRHMLTWSLSEGTEDDKFYFRTVEQIIYMYYTTSYVILITEDNKVNFVIIEELQETGPFQTGQCIRFWENNWEIMRVTLLCLL